MYREETAKLKAGDEVDDKTGKRRKLKVVKVEMDSGAYHGWVTCTDGKYDFLYAGEEIERAKQ